MTEQTKSSGLGRRGFFTGAALGVAGAGVIASAPAAQAATPLPTPNWFNVTDAPYNAVGDGKTDDTAAIQSAIDAAGGNGGGVVYFPAGVYLVTPGTTGAALTLSGTVSGVATGYSGVRLVGDSQQASHIRKASAGVMISMSGPAGDISGATHCRFCTIEHLYLDGADTSGTMLQTYYADDLEFSDVRFLNNLDVVQDTAEFWDSRYYNCVWDTNGSSTANASTPNVLLRNTAATSGFGYSTDTVNNIYFFGCRWEQFTTGAVWIERGVGTNSGQPYSIYLTSSKMESATINGGPTVYVETTARDVHIAQLHAYVGGFGSGYSTAQDVITFGPQFGSLKDILIFNSTGTACIANGVTLNAPLAKAYVVAENVRGSYTDAVPTGAHINFGTATGGFIVDNCTCDNGTRFAGNLPSTATNQIISAISGTGLMSLTNGAAVSGDTSADLAITEAAATSTAFGLMVTGDSVLRYQLNADGDAVYGDGTAADFTVKRVAEGVLGASKSLLVGSGTDLGDGGVGVLKVADATTTPTANPAGGVVLYAVSGVLKYRTPEGLIPVVGGTIQTSASTGTATVADTTAAGGLQSYVIPANDAQAGTVYALEGWGVYSTTGTPTLTFDLYWGGSSGTVIAGIAAITLPSGVTGVPFSYQAEVVFASTTTCSAKLELNLGTSASTGATTRYLGTPAAQTTGLTTTSAESLAMAVKWSAASSANTITLLGGHIRRLA